MANNSTYQERVMTELVECWKCRGSGFMEHDYGPMPEDRIVCDECGGTGCFEDEKTDCPGGYCEMCRSGVKCY